MNWCDYIFLDFETGSKNRHKTQPLQLAAVAIDGRKLEIQETFNSLIKPIMDEQQCAELGLDMLQDEALKKNKLNVDELLNAPSPKEVMSNFAVFVDRYNSKKNDWSRPIMAGFNIYGFDDAIINRLAKEHGYWDEEEQVCNLFNRIHKFDIFHDVFRWFENAYSIKRMNMDAIREMLGMPLEGSHNALKDVQDGAKVMIRFLNLYRKMYPRIKFRGSMKDD